MKIKIIETCGQCTEFECGYRTPIGSAKSIPKKCPLPNYPCQDCEFRDERDQYRKMEAKELAVQEKREAKQNKK